MLILPNKNALDMLKIIGSPVLISVHYESLALKDRINLQRKRARLRIDSTIKNVTVAREKVHPICYMRTRLSLFHGI